MKSKILSKVLAIVGGLATIYCAYNAYTIIAGIWIPYNKDGVPVGPTGDIIAAVIAAAVTVVGIVLWVRDAKKSK